MQCCYRGLGQSAQIIHCEACVTAVTTGLPVVTTNIVVLHSTAFFSRDTILLNYLASTDVMWRLAVTKLFLCLWVVKKGGSHLQDTLKELNTEFAVSFYQKLAETENNSNLIVSPASVSVTLGLLQFGAKGNTFSQLESALGYNVNDHRVQEFLHRMYEDVTNSSQSTVLQLACALFVQNGTKLSPAFAQYVSSWVNSSLQQANFSEPNRTRTQISQWVHSQSGGEITDVMSCDLIGSTLTQIAMVNIVFFKSTWQKEFLITETQNLPFTIADGSTLKVPMMYQAAEVNFGQFKTPAEQRFTVVELSYLGNAISMLVVLPSERRTSLSLIEPYITARGIALWASSLRKIKMDVFLPRFKIQNKFNLKTVLHTLGIIDLFDPDKADFRGISEQDSLYVSEAIHEAKIEVTEEGTKASAVTAMVLLKRSRAPVFKADRPFFFLLRQANTGSILFVGRVQNPLA
ncbi:putative serpin E3 isoform X2 [Acipenser oxyrinchus oxyrinchus]|uniref:Serpin E3 isoform X2 n=1 Tax=Acipenser oxyrinchus oxyrinchus TaxID=40147 RepID=A0AAD8G7T1_ACIOX|nr:putative serpin E3 isoform X2 [Acipenser oxyrinchus oxyrinchus]